MNVKWIKFIFFGVLLLCYLCELQLFYTFLCVFFVAFELYFIYFNFYFMQRVFPDLFPRFQQKSQEKNSYLSCSMFWQSLKSYYTCYIVVLRTYVIHSLSIYIPSPSAFYVDLFLFAQLFDKIHWLSLSVKILNKDITETYAYRIFIQVRFPHSFWLFRMNCSSSYSFYYYFKLNTCFI